MLRRFSTTTTTTIVPLKLTNRCVFRFCSSNSNSNNETVSPPPQQQQKPKLPEVLQQFDQCMRANPEWRQLYPKLLKAIVDKSKQDVIDIATKMIDGAQATTTQNTDENVPQVKSELTIEEIKHKLKLHMVVVDVAFADMFYHGEEVETTEGGENNLSNNNNKQTTINPIKEEEAAEELLELLLKYFGEDFKKQKARIANYVVKLIQQEREHLMEKEKGLQLRVSEFSAKEEAKSEGKKKAKGILNCALTITPPIDADNVISASALMNQIRSEISQLCHSASPASTNQNNNQQKHSVDQIVASVLRRRVFPGAVLVSGDQKTVQEQETKIQGLTEKLFQLQKKKAVGDVEFDPDYCRLACQIAVEEDFVASQQQKQHKTGISSSINENLLRFDIGIEEHQFSRSIGLDHYFEIVNDGDDEKSKTLEEMYACANEICKRVSNKLNEGFRNPTTEEGGELLFKEEAILPFSFTMRCKVF